jgi:hypothetical protein
MELDKMNSLCIVTAYTPEGQWKELGDISVLTMREYADRHGLDLKVFTDGFDNSRAPTWSKIRFIKRVLPDYDWIWWLDADATIMNQKIDVRSFLESTADILACKDAPAPEGCGILNAGSFFVRNCPFSFWILNEVWKREDLANKAFHEQEALVDLYKEGHLEDRVAIFETRDFNSFIGWNKTMKEDLSWHVGDFVAHCAGCPIEHRLEILKEISKFTIR